MLNCVLCLQCIKTRVRECEFYLGGSYNAGKMVSGKECNKHRCKKHIEVPPRNEKRPQADPLPIKTEGWVLNAIFSEFEE